MRTSSRCVQGKQRFHYYFVTLLGYVNEIKVVKQLPAGGENFRFFCITASLSHLSTMLSESSSWPLPAKLPNHAT